MVLYFNLKIFSDQKYTVIHKMMLIIINTTIISNRVNQICFGIFIFCVNVFNFILIP